MNLLQRCPLQTFIWKSHKVLLQVDFFQRFSIEKLLSLKAKLERDGILCVPDSGMRTTAGYQPS